MKLRVNLIYDKDCKGCVVDVPELPGCMSQGKTIGSTLKNARQAIALYLETAPRSKRHLARYVLTAIVEV